MNGTHAFEPRCWPGSRSINRWVGIVLIAIAGSASAQTWQVEYDADLGSLPSAQGFTAVHSDPLPDDSLNEGNYLVSLGALTQGDTGGPNADGANTQFYEQLITPFDFDDDMMVIEARLKILSSTSTLPGAGTPEGGFSIVLVDASRDTLVLHFAETGVFFRDFASPDLAEDYVAFDTTADFADYRLRIDRHDVRVSIDGVVMLDLERDAIPNLGVDGSVLRFGDYSTTKKSSSQLESIRVSRYEPNAREVRRFSHQTAIVGPSSSATKTTTVTCPSGTYALGGGARTEGAVGSVAIAESYPGGGAPPTRWTVSAREVVDTGDSWELHADVLCGLVSGYEYRVIPEVIAQSTDAAKNTPSPVICPDHMTNLGGGVQLTGTDLRQAITSAGVTWIGHPDYRNEHAARVSDYGAGTSSSAWGFETSALCVDAFDLETIWTDEDGILDPTRSFLLLCPSGKRPIAGGVRAAGSGFPTAVTASSPHVASPGEPPIGWRGTAMSDAPMWSFEAAVVCAPESDPTITRTGLMSQWKGEFDTWDSFGHGHLYPPGPAPGYAAGVDGQGFDFAPESDEHVKVPGEFEKQIKTIDDRSVTHDLYPEGEFTVDAWIVKSSLPPSADVAMIYSLYDPGGSSGSSNFSTSQLYVDDAGTAVASLRDAVDSSVTVVDSSIVLTDGQPHHLAMMRDLDMDRLYLYVDGVLAEEKALGALSSALPLYPESLFFADNSVFIGAQRAPGSEVRQRSFGGVIDDVKYWDRALSPEDIRNIAGCQLPIVPRMLNLEATRHADPGGGGDRLCVFLEAGSYDLTLHSPDTDPEARARAWAGGAGWPWGTQYSVEPEIDPGFVAGAPASFGTPQAAFDATPSKTTTLTLGSAQKVWFSLIDAGDPMDNAGGVSIKVVPEPANGLLMGAGLLLLRGLDRARRRRTSSISAHADREARRSS